MKKVGIMSMQRIYNYGSFLQGYGLKKLIESLDSDIDVTFIDYVPGEVLEAKSEVKKNSIQRLYRKLREYNKVDSTIRNKVRFFNHKRTYAKRFYPLLGLSKTQNFDTNVDVQVIGSDEVFNSIQANENVGYSRDLYGHKSTAKKIISYAGSFGNTSYEKIEAYGLKDDLIEDFSKFNAISVRDINSSKIIENLICQRPSINVDPAIAYNYMELEEQIPTKRLYKNKYILVYGYSGRLTDKENKALKEYSRKKNVKILCIGGVQGCCDEFIDCNPFELLAYFRDAEAIITDTFHGTIFSIINNKPFASIIRKSLGKKYGNEEKLGYLLDFFNLSSQKVVENISEIESILNHHIDYDSVNAIISKEREKSINYLKQNIL